MNIEDFPKFAVDLQTKLVNFKREFAMEFKSRVEQRTPVRTGALKGGWHIELKSTEMELSNTQEYMPYVEFGTPSFGPRAMVRTTLLESDQIIEVAKERAGIKE